MKGWQVLWQKTFCLLKFTAKIFQDLQSGRCSGMSLCRSSLWKDFLTTMQRLSWLIYENLYVGESIRHKADKIKWKIRHNAGQIDIYVIAIASNPQNLLDIIPAQELMQKGYPKKELYVIGLAKGMSDAHEIVKQIIDEVYRNTGGFDIQSYLQICCTSPRYYCQRYQYYGF